MLNRITPIFRSLTNIFLFSSTIQTPRYTPKSYNNYKSSYQPPSIQIYNSNLNYDCGDVLAKFVILSPGYYAV